MWVAVVVVAVEAWRNKDGGEVVAAWGRNTTQKKRGGGDEVVLWWRWWCRGWRASVVTRLRQPEGGKGAWRR
ncbi:hypothetical protein Tco_1358919, partial [Tanacetum coccineum]